MAENVDDGVSYLRSLKQSGSQQATAATPARENMAKSHPQSGRFQGTDKRRSIRYKCEGSADMRPEGSKVHTWASFTDISLHGCYVEAHATYPVGTVLHLKLEANGVRMENTGTVRVSYPQLGMGIAFQEVSESTRQVLREMLGRMAQPSTIVGPGVASSLPGLQPREALPPVVDPAAALQALIGFFENRQMLMREDFLRIVRTSQAGRTKR